MIFYAPTPKIHKIASNPCNMLPPLRFLQINVVVRDKEITFFYIPSVDSTMMHTEDTMLPHYNCKVAKT